MDKQTCAALLNILGIYNINSNEIITNKLPNYTVIFYVNTTQGAGFIYKLKPSNSAYKLYKSYSSYKKLLNAAIIMNKEKKHG